MITLCCQSDEKYLSDLLKCQLFLQAPYCSSVSPFFLSQACGGFDRPVAQRAGQRPEARRRGSGAQDARPRAPPGSRAPRAARRPAARRTTCVPSGPAAAPARAAVAHGRCCLTGRCDPLRPWRGPAAPGVARSSAVSQSRRRRGRCSARPATWISMPFAPHRAARVGPVADAVRRAEQRHLGAVDERPARRQALQPGGDPAGLRFGKADRRGARHAQRRGEHDPPPGRIDPQRGAARARRCART